MSLNYHNNIFCDITGLKVEELQKVVENVVGKNRKKKTEKFLTVDSEKYADSGYQGWQKLQSNVVIPYKKYRATNGGAEGAHRKLSSFKLKVFKILSQTYRNFQKKCNMRFNIIASW